VWNEDLIRALRARHQQCQSQGKQRQYTWRQGAEVIESVRQDIYVCKTGRIVGLPTDKLTRTVDDLCRKLIAGTEPVIPPGWVDPGSIDAGGANGNNNGNPYFDDPYLKRIKSRGGAMAILLAFHVSPRDVLSKSDICRIGQQFCDDIMEANFHQGRLHGAWSANKTLVKHGLMQANGTARYDANAGGFRSQGAWSYCLTRNGRQFLEALLQTRPEIQEQVDQATGNFGTPATARSSAASMPEYDFDIGGGGIFAPNRVIPYAAAHSAVPRSRGKASASSQKDEQELRDWVRTASVGQQKEFVVGKARRKYLHDLCDDLNIGLGNRQLTHSSTNTGPSSKRALYVTVVPRPGASSMVSSGSAFDVYDSDALDDLGFSAIPPVKRSPVKRPAFTGSAHRLEASSPPKRSKPIPASEAAANAALARQAIHESLLESKKQKAQRQPQAKKALFQEPWKKPSAPAVVDLLGPGEQKMPAKSSSSKPKVVEILDSDDGDDDDDDDSERIPSPSCFARDQVRKVKPPAAVACIDVDSDEGSGETQPISIIIDSRERNRNATPRTLRMELTRLVGDRNNNWPSSLPPPTVKEAVLPLGDFAFDAGKDGIPYANRRLPVYIERKVSTLHLVVLVLFKSSCTTH